MTEETSPEHISILKEINENLGKISQSLENLSNFANIWFHPIIFKSLKKIFKTPIQFQAYLLLEKEIGLREIGDLIGVSRTTVGNWFKSWSSDLKIVDQLPNGSYRQKMSIYELLMIYGNFNDEEEKSDE